MLTREQAGERLKAFTKPNYKEEQVKRITALSGMLSLYGQRLAGVGPVYAAEAKNNTFYQESRLEAAVKVGQLPVADRLRLFRAIFGKIAPQVEAAWNLFEILPYQTGYIRRPFRSPNQPLPEARAIWISRLADSIQGYDQDVTWFAAWAPYLGYYFAPDVLGYLFAGAIEAGGPDGQAVFDILTASADGSHEIGAMGRHVVRGLLCSSRQAGWEFVERLLLAAQRAEGLRQVILESLDEAHPQAFRRLLRLILEHNLSRFSAAVRAFGVWFGVPMETVSPKQLNDLLTDLERYLNDPAAREQAIQSGAAEQAYYALWALAFEDVRQALPRAAAMGRAAEPQQRFVAVHLLAQMHLEECLPELLRAVDDDHLPVAARALQSLHNGEFRQHALTESDLFERLERLIQRMPHKENTLTPLIWDWFELKLTRTELANRLLNCLGSRPARRLLPYLVDMDPYGRSRMAALLKDPGRKDSEARATLLRLVGDPSPQVRGKALEALHDFELTETEIQDLEALLGRQASDLRRGVLQLLLELPDEGMLRTADRLLQDKNGPKRHAGLELLSESVRAGRKVDFCRKLAVSYQERAVPLMENEKNLLDEILARDVQQYSLQDALGLLDPQKRTKPHPPQNFWAGLFKKSRICSPAAIEIILALEALIETNRDEAVDLNVMGMQQTQLLGNVQYGFPLPDPSLPLADDLARLPLRTVWENWWQNRPAEMRDPDGMELLRTLAVSLLFQHQWLGPNRSRAYITSPLRKIYEIPQEVEVFHNALITSILKWLVRAYAPQNEVLFLVESLERSIGCLSESEIARTQPLTSDSETRLRRLDSSYLAYLNICRWHRSIRPDAWKPEDHARVWRVARWVDEPKSGLDRYYPDIEDALLGMQAGAATPDDLFDLLLGQRPLQRYGNPFRLLRDLSHRKPGPLFAKYPALNGLIEACRERILSIELRRGDLPTAASVPALALQAVPGSRNLFRLLAALGKTDFERGFHFSDSRASVLSSLIRVSYPTEADTPEEFGALAAGAGIPPRRLVEVAVFAPQWAGWVEAWLGWPKLAEAVFWVYAHTKDRMWSVDKDFREQWAAQISEYTPISADQLMDGAVDVAWFQGMYQELGETHWAEVYRCADLTAGGNGHARARLFADALLSKISPQELLKRIQTKRNQDAVRALGLVPLPVGPERQAEVLRRYEAIQEFGRGSKKFGSQRQASEKLALAIALENLARSAGYRDPQRLEWAMEVQAVADLQAGSIQVEVEGIQITLSINALGEPELSSQKNGKTLKTLPANAKKDPGTAALLERAKNLERQVSRMRLSLEQSMCRGDAFLGSELRSLTGHPMLRAMLAQLVWVGQAGLGYPLSDGSALRALDGEEIPVSPTDTLRLAHPYDLLGSGEWQRWQHECFTAERIQPFKQVFRELYLLTAAERSEGMLSRRYAGQQVNPRQAFALFGGRGWVADPGEGVHKTFHGLGITARIGFLQTVFTPAEVEGLTLEAVLFTRRGEWKPLPLEEIPALVFSEVMRDVDLVVSVAHAGSVDPEASASSIEARTTLVHETCALLNLRNVEVKNNHVLIEGQLGRYTVHLGSTVVHKQPGGALCILPVHAQQRGRLFIPFVDNDPKTAELISKVILLARDKEIIDPTILEQIL